MKLTTLEKRAKVACEGILENNGGDFGIEWRDSRMWGLIAVITNYRGEKAAEASGCGYDKESQVLANFLEFLCPSVISTGGAGYSAVQRACLKDGWVIERTASGKKFNGFRIEKLT